MKRKRGIGFGDYSDILKIMSIESRLYQIKLWYYQNWPLCLFCNHRVRDGKGQLAHIIRRSYQSSKYSREELQTMKLNTGLAHHACHEIYDNKPKEAVLLPRFLEVQFILWLIDPGFFEQQKLIYEDFFNFPDFAGITNKYPHLAQCANHGDLLYLPVDI